MSDDPERARRDIEQLLRGLHPPGGGAGDVAVVIERHTTQYELRGQTYRDSGRTTWVLHRDAGRWLVTHSHWESLAPNRIVDRDP